MSVNIFTILTQLTAFSSLYALDNVHSNNRASTANILSIDVSSALINSKGHEHFNHTKDVKKQYIEQSSQSVPTKPANRNGDKPEIAGNVNKKISKDNVIVNLNNNSAIYKTMARHILKYGGIRIFDSNNEHRVLEMKLVDGNLNTTETLSNGTKLSSIMRNVHQDNIISHLYKSISLFKFLMIEMKNKIRQNSTLKITSRKNKDKDGLKVHVIEGIKKPKDDNQTSKVGRRNFGVECDTDEAQGNGPEPNAMASKTGPGDSFRPEVEHVRREPKIEALVKPFETKEMEQGGGMGVPGGVMASQGLAPENSGSYVGMEQPYQEGIGGSGNGMGMEPVGITAPENRFESGPPTGYEQNGIAPPGAYGQTLGIDAVGGIGSGIGTPYGINGMEPPRSGFGPDAGIGGTEGIEGGMGAVYGSGGMGAPGGPGGEIGIQMGPDYESGGMGPAGYGPASGNALPEGGMALRNGIGQASYPGDYGPVGGMGLGQGSGPPDGMGPQGGYGPGGEMGRNAIGIGADYGPGGTGRQGGLGPSSGMGPNGGMNMPEVGMNYDDQSMPEKVAGLPGAEFPQDSGMGLPEQGVGPPNNDIMPPETMVPPVEGMGPVGGVMIPGDRVDQGGGIESRKEFEPPREGIGSPGGEIMPVKEEARGVVEINDTQSSVPPDDLIYKQGIDEYASSVITDLTTTKPDKTITTNTDNIRTTAATLKSPVTGNTDSSRSITEKSVSSSKIYPQSVTEAFVLPEVKTERSHSSTDLNTISETVTTKTTVLTTETQPTIAKESSPNSITQDNDGFHNQSDDYVTTQKPVFRMRLLEEDKEIQAKTEQTPSTTTVVQTDNLFDVIAELESKTNSAIGLEINTFVSKMMEIDSGYFTTFASLATEYLAVKNETIVSELAQAFVKEFDIMSKDYKWILTQLGKRLRTALEDFKSTLMSENVSALINYARIVTHGLNTRNTSLSFDLNMLLSFVDSLYMPAEGSKLAHVAELINDYPNSVEHGYNASYIMKEVLYEVLLNPFMRLGTSLNKKLLIDAVTAYLNKNFDAGGYHMNRRDNATIAHFRRAGRPKKVPLNKKGLKATNGTLESGRRKYRSFMKKNLQTQMSVVTYDLPTYVKKKQKKKTTVTTPRLTLRTHFSPSNNEMLHLKHHLPKVYDKYLKHNRKFVYAHERNKMHKYDKMINDYLKKRKVAHEKHKKKTLKLKRFYELVKANQRADAAKKAKLKKDFLDMKDTKGEQAALRTETRNENGVVQVKQTAYNCKKCVNTTSDLTKKKQVNDKKILKKKKNMKHKKKRDKNKKKKDNSKEKRYVFNGPTEQPYYKRIRDALLQNLPDGGNHQILRTEFRNINDISNMLDVNKNKKTKADYMKERKVKNREKYEKYEKYDKYEKEESHSKRKKHHKHHHKTKHHYTKAQTVNNNGKKQPYYDRLKEKLLGNLPNYPPYDQGFFPVMRTEDRNETEEIVIETTIITTSEAPKSNIYEGGQNGQSNRLYNENKHAQKPNNLLGEYTNDNININFRSGKDYDKKPYIKKSTVYNYALRNDIKEGINNKNFNKAVEFIKHARPNIVNNNHIIKKNIKPIRKHENIDYVDLSLEQSSEEYENENVARESIHKFEPDYALEKTEQEFINKIKQQFDSLKHRKTEISSGNFHSVRANVRVTKTNRMRPNDLLRHNTIANKYHKKASVAKTYSPYKNAVFKVTKNPIQGINYNNREVFSYPVVRPQWKPQHQIQRQSTNDPRYQQDSRSHKSMLEPTGYPHYQHSKRKPLDVKHSLKKKIEGRGSQIYQQNKVPVPRYAHIEKNRREYDLTNRREIPYHKVTDEVDHLSMKRHQENNFILDNLIDNESEDNFLWDKIHEIDNRLNVNLPSRRIYTKSPLERIADNSRKYNQARQANPVSQLKREKTGKKSKEKKEAAMKNPHLRKIIEASSYSDEEYTLRLNLQDALLHPEKTRNGRRSNSGFGHLHETHSKYPHLL